jgi:hypothetical protein
VAAEIGSQIPILGMFSFAGSKSASTQPHVLAPPGTQPDTGWFLSAYLLPDY